MAIDRRLFLTGAASALALRPASAASEPGGRFAAACTGPAGDTSVAIFDRAGGDRRLTPIPARGHDVAIRPNSREAVIFARRPGRFAVVFDVDGRAPPRQLDADDARHFYGHGVYSPDGKLLFSTENDVAGGRGVLGIRDATAGYRSLGLFATGGIGPHDVALLSDRKTLVIANGGIDTDPAGREALNRADMSPSLTYVAIASGDILERVELTADLKALSIRHLAVGAGDKVVFACQWEGAQTEHPPLVGIHERGRAPQLLAMPDVLNRRLKNYIGSVAVDPSGEVAVATSPKGGLAVCFSVVTGKFLAASELADVCGVAGTSVAHEFLLTGGAGDISRRRIDDGGALQVLSSATDDLHWDNHIALVAG